MENQQDNVETPKPSEINTNPNPFPTTFVQADTSSFKQVVQMLTGSAETAVANPNPSPPPPPQPQPQPQPKNSMGPKKPTFKLYERRNSTKNLNIISPLVPAFSPRKQPEILSPSILHFPSLALSPVTPLILDPFHRSSSSSSSSTMSVMKSEEERAIAERGFYLHPSPRSRNNAEPPRLLPLFPVTSPRILSSSCSSSNSHSGVV